MLPGDKRRLREKRLPREKRRPREREGQGKERAKGKEKAKEKGRPREKRSLASGCGAKSSSLIQSIDTNNLLAAQVNAMASRLSASH